MGAMQITQPRRQRRRRERRPPTVQEEPLMERELPRRGRPPREPASRGPGRVLLGLRRTAEAEVRHQDGVRKPPALPGAVGRSRGRVRVQQRRPHRAPLRRAGVPQGADGDGVLRRPDRRKEARLQQVP